VRIQPDLVHTRTDGTAIVIDAKYSISSGAGRNPDRYQMHAYCTALRAPRGYLVYASGGVPRHIRIRNTTIDVIEYPLDLAAEPADVLAQVSTLARIAALT
jgi:5-methylcytosine-specific restriction enzyme subunit McrC